MWVYIQSSIDPPLWTVGFYDPQGQWVAETDHASAEAAARRVNYLNGATQPQSYPPVVVRDRR